MKRFILFIACSVAVCAKNPSIKKQRRSMVKAAARGDVDLVARYSERPQLQPKRWPAETTTPLHAAAHHGQTAVVQQLLAVGFSPFVQDHSSAIPLYYGIIQRHKPVVGCLLQAAPDVQEYQRVVVDSFGEHKWHDVLLWAAVHHGGPTLVARLLQAGFNPKIGELLHDPSIGVRTTQLLIAAGADKDSRNARYSTPLAKAVCHNKKPLVRYFLSIGCDLFNVDVHGNNVMHLAARQGDIQMLDVLVACARSRGVPLTNLWSTLNNTAATPLHTAVVRNNREYAQRLISLGANVHDIDFHRNSVLHITSLAGDVDMTDWAVAQGCDVQASNRDGDTPLVFAIRHTQHHFDVVQRLLSLGANVNTVNRYGNTMHSLAVMACSPSILEAVLIAQM